MFYNNTDVGACGVPQGCNLVPLLDTIYRVLPIWKMIKKLFKLFKVSKSFQFKKNKENSAWQNKSILA